jgi:hypothetical protein
MTTPGLLEKIGITKYQVVVREDEYRAYRQAGTPAENLMTVAKGYGLNKAREETRWEVRDSEWCLHMDDNVRGFIMPNKKFYKLNDHVPLGPKEKMITRKRWQSTMNEEVDFGKFYDMIILDTLREAQKRGAFLAGFSAHENPAFRAKKFTDVGYVCGKVMLMRNQGLAWNQSSESACEDYALTAAHLYHNGRVLVNKWGYPKRVHYQAGGCGPYEERLPAMRRAQQELIARYGNVFGAKNANNPEKKQGELRIRFNSLEQVEAWRKTFKKNPNWSTR